MWTDKFEIDVVTGCMNWTGAKDDSGKGVAFRGHKRVLAHRMAFEAAMGRPVKPGLFIFRTCKNIRCINPAHLEEGDRYLGAKLTESDVRQIKIRLKQGEAAHSLAKTFQVSPPTIQRIQKGVAWSHV